MDRAELGQKLRSVTSPLALAQLVNELLEDSLFEDEPSWLKSAVEEAALLPFAPQAAFERLGEVCFYPRVLLYGGTHSHLEAARAMFEAWGVPETKEGSFLEELWEAAAQQSGDYAVKLYLLASAYSEKENHIRFLSEKKADFSRIEDFALRRSKIRCECCGCERQTVSVYHKDSGLDAAELEL